VADNATGVSTLYNTSGTPQSLVVTIPKPGGGTSAPTGTVYANISGSFNADLFLFATENGTILGWRSALGTTAETLLDNSFSGAIYKGMAIGTVSGNSYVYAADFHNAAITVLPGTGAPALSGNFVDPGLPAGYAPFNIQRLGTKLYVTYAQQDATGTDEVAGAGFGFVDTFDFNGLFQSRFASQGALNAPWGLAVAPAGFGNLAGDVLVGNFGDGLINAYDPNGSFVGTLADTVGNPLVNDGLWGLTFGNGGNGGNLTSLYLTAGLNDEADGLFARIDAPEPCMAILVAVVLLGVRSRKVQVGC
jgi:uncharacterized protein (TIGR03118 family)